MVNPPSRRGSCSPYSWPTIVDALTLKNPVPIATSAMPRKNVGVDGTAMQKWPAAMMAPPTTIDRCVPHQRSAMTPPRTGSA